MHNDHNTSIPAETLNEVGGLFKQILEKLKPYHQPLTSAERREMAVIGDKTFAFVEKGKEYAELYPDIVPAWLDKNDLDVDYEDMRNILPVKNLADQAREALYNIQCISGSESYHWVLDFYQGVKHAAGRDVPNAKLVAVELGKRFQRKRRRPGSTGGSSPE